MEDFLLMVHIAYSSIWLQPTPLAEDSSYLSTASKTGHPQPVTLLSINVDLTLQMSFGNYINKYKKNVHIIFQVSERNVFQKLVELIFLNAEKYLIPFTVICENSNSHNHLGVTLAKHTLYLATL